MAAPNCLHQVFEAYSNSHTAFRNGVPVCPPVPEGAPLFMPRRYDPLRMGGSRAECRADIRAPVVPARPERGVCAAKITDLSIS